MTIQLNDVITHKNYIHAYDQNLIRIGNESFSSSLIATPSIIRIWEPNKFTDIIPHHLNYVLEIKPEIILLGTGTKQYFPTGDLLSWISENNINIEFMDTGATCRSYNILLEEGRNVAALLILAT